MPYLLIIMTTDITALQQSLTAIVSVNPIDLVKLGALLNVSDFTSNQLFQANIGNIVSIITKDRDGDGKLTINDIKLMSTDIPSMAALASSLMLVIASLPEALDTITYTQVESEQLIFKLLVYVFIVVVPQKTGLVLTSDDTTALLNTCLVMYQLMITSNIIPNVISKIEALFKSKGWCQCCCSTKVIPPTTVTTKSLEFNNELDANLNRIKQFSLTNRRLDILNDELTALKKDVDVIMGGNGLSSNNLSPSNETNNNPNPIKVEVI
jgi:hypothetical protein